MRQAVRQPSEDDSSSLPVPMRLTGGQKEAAGSSKESERHRSNNGQEEFLHVSALRLETWGRSHPCGVSVRRDKPGDVGMTGQTVGVGKEAGNGRRLGRQCRNRLDLRRERQ